MTYTWKPIIHNFYRCPLRCYLLHYATLRRGFFHFILTMQLTLEQVTRTQRNVHLHINLSVIYSSATSLPLQRDRMLVAACLAGDRWGSWELQRFYLISKPDWTWLTSGGKTGKKIASWYTYICEGETKWGCKGVWSTRKRELINSWYVKQKGERMGNKLPVPRYIIQEVLQRNRKCDNFGLPCYMNYRGTKLSLGEYMNNCIENTSFGVMKRQETRATSTVNCQ